MTLSSPLMMAVLAIDLTHDAQRYPVDMRKILRYAVTPEQAEFYRQAIAARQNTSVQKPELTNTAIQKKFLAEGAKLCGKNAVVYINAKNNVLIYEEDYSDDGKGTPLEKRVFEKSLTSLKIVQEQFLYQNPGNVIHLRHSKKDRIIVDARKKKTDAAILPVAFQVNLSEIHFKENSNSPAGDILKVVNAYNDRTQELSRHEINDLNLLCKTLQENDLLAKMEEHQGLIGIMTAVQNLKQIRCSPETTLANV